MVSLRHLERLDWQRSARTEAGYWAMLAVGLAFIYAGFTIDPATNCSEGGACAPWLVPVATLIGLGATALALGTLIANPQRGCRFNRQTGELEWWQKRTLGSRGEEGRIDPAQIARVRLAADNDGDTISLYDHHGTRLPHFDGNVVPWPHVRWVEQLVARWPHIAVDVAS